MHSERVQKRKFFPSPQVEFSISHGFMLIWKLMDYNRWCFMKNLRLFPKRNWIRVCFISIQIFEISIVWVLMEILLIYEWVKLSFFHKSFMSFPSILRTASMVGRSLNKQSYWIICSLNSGKFMFLWAFKWFVSFNGK